MHPTSPAVRRSARALRSLTLGAAVSVTAVPVTTVSVAAVSSFTAHAEAQSLGLDEALAKLDAETPDDVRMGIEGLGMLGSPRGVDPLAARIRRGLPPDLLDAAIDTLMVLGRPEAGPVLFELAAHRRPAVRTHAAQAIAACRPRGAERVLVAALSDLDPGVRGAAASALGELGLAGAVDSLLLALDRDVPEAGPALGRTVGPSEVPALLSRLGRVPFGTMRAALGEVLARRELPARARLEVVSRMAELATPEARAFLEDAVASMGVPASDPVRRAAQDALERIVR